MPITPVSKSSAGGRANVSLPTDARRIVVVCPTWVGDLVMATPAFAALRQRYREAQIAYLLRPPLMRIVADAPWFDALLPYHKKRFGDTLRLLFTQKYDLGILLTNSFRSAALLTLARVKHRIGYDRHARGWMLTQRLAAEKDGHAFRPVSMVDYYLRMVSPESTLPASSRRLSLYFRPALAAAAEEYLHKLGIAAQEPFIALNPGASYGPAKCWGTSHFAALADLLYQETGRRSLLLCGPGEESLLREILEHAQHPEALLDTSSDIIPLDILKPIIKRCDLLITNDTGTRHYGAALDVPVITLLGPTDPTWGNTGYPRDRVLRSSVPCAPCMQRVCPLGHHLCMKNITPAWVLREAKEILTKASMKNGNSL